MEKPDFKSLRMYWNDRYQEHFNAGCERIWNDYVTPLVKERDELQYHFNTTDHELEQVEKRNAELTAALEKCDKTFGLIDEIINALKSAGRSDLNDLVNEIDIDIPLIQAKIRDTYNTK